MRFNYREIARNSEGYVAYESTVEGIEVFFNKELLTAKCFTGKRTKPDWQYRFKNFEQMVSYIEDSIEKVYNRNKAKLETKAKEKAQAVQNRENVKVGDLFKTSWGYEQTNVDFFEVIERPTKATAIIRKVQSETVRETSWCSADIKAIKGAYIGETKKVQIDVYGNLTSADNYGHKAYKADWEQSYYKSWGY